MTVPPKTRLCHFFDKYGYPVDNGCPRIAATCHFVHPSDPEWTKLLANIPTSAAHSDSHRRSAAGSSPRRSSPPSSSSNYERERGRSFSNEHQRGSSESSLRRKRTPPRGSGSHHSVRSPVLPSRSPRRDDSPPRRPGPSNVNRYDRQPDPPSKSVFKPPLPPGERSSGKEKVVVPANSLKGTAVAVSMSSSAATSTTPKPSSGTSSTTPGSGRAPPKPFSEVLPPPPSINTAPSKDEMPPEQRRVVWEKRIALMADVTQEYMVLGKLEKDLESRRRQVQSPAFNTLPSDIKNAFEASLKSAEVTYERKKVSFNGAINKLSETDFWPPVSSQRASDMEAKLKEAKLMLGSLADSVGQLYKRIESLYGQRPGPGPSGASTSGAGGSATASEGGDGDPRAKKRRRISSADGGDNGDATPQEVGEDVEAIKDTIREIEDRLREVENDVTQHSRDIVEQLEAKLDEKIEEIARSSDVAALVETQLGAQTAQMIQAYDESFAQADQEISELAQETADLIPRLDELRRDNDVFKQEEAADKELLAQLVKTDQENAEAIARLQEEAKTLRGALTAQTKRGLPAIPVPPFPGPFMNVIKGSVAAQVHEQVLPVLTQVRAEMERMAKIRDAELYEKLRDKLDQSAKMSQLIATWIERNPDEAHRTLAAAAARAQVDGAGSSDSMLA